jgi:hypothetical protein
MTQRERDRLRSERRRRAKAREATVRQCALASVERTFERAEAFVHQLQADLDRCAETIGSLSAFGRYALTCRRDYRSCFPHASLFGRVARPSRVVH